MRTIFLVIKQEIITILGKRSFWITTFLLPTLIIVLNVGAQVVARDAFEEENEFMPTEEGASEPIASGYVDEAGLVNELPPGIPAAALQAFPDEAAAKAALEAGEIRSYFLVPADFWQTGEIVMVAQEFRPFSNSGETNFEYILAYNLTEDESVANLVVDPTPRVEEHALAPASESRDATNPLTFWIPFATMFVFFFLITMSSGFMLQSVSREKENRTVEVLLLSLRPRELMLGKVLGLSVIALFQMAIWVGGGLLFLGRGRDLLGAASAFSMPPGFLLWGILYFLLGFLMYASLMGAIGALAPNAREAGQFTFIILLPLFIPLWMNNVFIQAPNGLAALILSLFPLTAPPSMMTRLAASGGVPLWQPILGVVLLAITAYLLVLLAARFFRADTLLSSAAVGWNRILTEWRK